MPCWILRAQRNNIRFRVFSKKKLKKNPKVLVHLGGEFPKSVLMGLGFRAGLQKLGQKIGLLSRIEVQEETVKKGVLHRLLGSFEN